VLELEDDHAPPPEAELRAADKVVGRVTSSVPGLALAYVRKEVEDGAVLGVDERLGRLRPGSR
jgi:hypothetical protein